MANPIKAVKVAKKAAERVKTNAIQKNSVKVKLKTSKPKRNSPDYLLEQQFNRARRSIDKNGGRG